MPTCSSHYHISIHGHCLTTLYICHKKSLTRPSSRPNSSVSPDFRTPTSPRSHDLNPAIFMCQQSFPTPQFRHTFPGLAPTRRHPTFSESPHFWQLGASTVLEPGPKISDRQHRRSAQRSHFEPILSLLQLIKGVLTFSFDC